MPGTVTGLAAPLALTNVDTDVIMPKRFLITISREGLADGAFADLRFDDTGNIRPDFILNRAPWSDATILVVGDNFGCGSSREHAVWGMRQLGIDACIGTGFAGIFYDNARKNGLALPVVSAEARDAFLQLAGSENGVGFSVDIRDRTIRAGEMTIPFSMDDATRYALIHGADDTRDTLAYADAIQAYEDGLADGMRVSVIK
ncbi:3-isopropylmalate dehydratase small subunit [uncultured Roseobacter sp.]|uniref:3-isopropylmalate dehydratase small subunit n=1 Tax=uncultured Roseobacter sp. TaxID=114847 RepID=UPI00260B2688|nr:3-isopropylmalate dehydratase small subunit [uncultured Roseobacter sp.]